MEAMWSQAALVWYYVRHDNTEEADTEYAKMLEVYKGQETLPKEIFQIGDIYRDEKKNYEKAVSLYTYQLENWPNYGEPTDIYRKLACTYIDMDDNENADLIIQQMQTNRAKDTHLARSNFDIGNYYLNDANDAENALKMHKFNADNHSDLMEAMWSQAALVWYYVRHDDQANADAEYAKLLDTFKKQDTLPKEVFQIGDIYREEKKYDKAISLYKYQLENWPEYGEPIDIYRKMACTYVDMNDIANADAVISDIQEKFAKNDNLARTNFDIGNYFLNDANDPENALKVHAYNADHYTNQLESMWSQAAIVWYHVRHDEDSKAEEAYAKLLDIFKDQKTLAKEVFQIADIYTEVGNYAKAIELAEYTIETWPESEYKLDAQKSIVKAKFDSNDFDAAGESLDALIADNEGNNDLARILFDFGDQYYEKGRGRIVNNKPNPEDADYQKTLVIWQKIYENLPLTSSYAKDAWFFSGAVYSRELRDFESAVSYYERVVEQWPDYQHLWSAQIMIADCYEKLLNHDLVSEDEALPYIEQAYEAFIKNHSDNKYYTYSLRKISDIKIKKNKWDEAAKYLEIFVEKTTKQDKRWLRAISDLENVYRNTGQEAMAMELHNLYLENTDSKPQRNQKEMPEVLKRALEKRASKGVEK